MVTKNGDAEIALKTVILGKVRSTADRGSINLTLMHDVYTYILASKLRSTLYIGVTRDIVRRVYQHKMNLAPGFTSRYNVKMLVHVETCDTAYGSITHCRKIFIKNVLDCYRHKFNGSSVCGATHLAKDDIPIPDSLKSIFLHTAEVFQIDDIIP